MCSNNHYLIPILRGFGLAAHGADHLVELLCVAGDPEDAGLAVAGLLGGHLQ